MRGDFCCVTEAPEAARVLRRIHCHKLPRTTLLLYICARCHVAHGINQRMTLIVTCESNQRKEKFYCDEAALAKLREREPRLTLKEFETRIAACEWLPRLYCYPVPSETGTPKGGNIP